MAKKTKQQNRQYTPPASASGGGEMANWFKKDISRRTASQRIGKGLAWGAVIGMAGVSFYKFALDDSDEVNFDSLELQRKEGWNVGSTEKNLVYNGGAFTPVDSQTRNDWLPYLDPNKLLAVYQPANPQWQPFFVPTLIQSLAQPTLRDQIKPYLTSDMRETYERAGGLRELLSQASNSAQTMIIADLPSGSAVALGAALADTVELVPGFDNWPHPLGVVRAHETLGGMLYYAREIEEKKSRLKPGSPAMILLDSQRLTPYKDEDTQFDNRYLAKLPPIDQLKQRGVANIIYLVRDESQKDELDDLNDDFVEFEKNGIGVRMLRLSDFKPYDEEVQTASTGAGGTPQVIHERHYYYGGSPFSHFWFYNHYWYQPYPTVIVTRGGRPTTFSRPSGAPPPPPVNYRPVTRPTIFSASRVGGSSGVGRSRPSGFGRTSVRMSGGRVVGTRAGRSGSYGRSGGWFGG
jgi:hypothetical protein